METYLPGQEPENIKKRLAKLFEKLDSAYPDKIVVSLYQEHKKWGETVTELYRILGYSDGKAFLEAYGYKYEMKKPERVGRPKSFEPKAIIEELQRRYPDGIEVNTVDELFDANPDLKGIKTLNNNAKAVFGMPLGAYLKSIGLVTINKRISQENQDAEQKETKEQKWGRLWEETISELLSRYEGKAVPDTFIKLAEENKDLNVNRLRRLSANLYGVDKSVLDVLKEIGLIDTNKLTVQQMGDVLKTLRERRWEQLCCSIAELEQKNPDLPSKSLIRQLPEYDRDPVEYLTKTTLFSKELVNRIKELEV